MEILTIRGSNLASLAGDFEIDLTAEPLRSAGIFAIIGETGAGKSTLFDALCLALYGDCPRLSDAGINDDIPDISGETLKSKDPRTVLRRGCSVGHAEVTFLAPDGHTYQCNWTVRRARGRAEGRLQNVERALVRLDDGSIIESSIRGVVDKVTELAGLTYDEFRRKILLAQGDFDAFLKAGTQDRAAILERVTGTGVYRSISKRTYERYVEAAKALELLEQRRKDYPVKTPEERLALEVEIASLKTDIEELKPALLSFEADIRRHKEVAAARGRVDAAEAAAANARTAAANADEDRKLLRRLRQAQGLRAEMTASISADRAMKDLQDQETTAIQVEATAQTALASALDTLNEAKDAYVAAEATFKGFAGDWDKAAELDAKIVTATGEVTSAKGGVTEAFKEVTDAATNLAELQGKKDALDNALEEVAAQRQRMPLASELARNWDDTRQAIERRQIHAARIAAADRVIADQEKARKAAADAIDALDVEDAAASKASDSLEAELENANKALEDFRKQNASTRMAKLQGGREAVSDMAQAASRWAEHQASHLRAYSDTTAEKERHGTAVKIVTLMEGEIPRLQGAVQALTAPLDRAEAALGTAASSLRHTLEDGAPCPVCGATEHPVQADAVLAEQARGLREDLAGARKALGEAEAARANAFLARDKASREIERLVEVLSQQDAARSRQMDAFASARIRAEATGLSELPETPENAGEALEGLLARIEIRRNQIQKILADEKTAGHAVEDLLKRQGVLAREAGLRAASRKEAGDRLATAVAAISAEANRATGARSAIEGIDGVLFGRLEAVNVAIETLDADTSGVLGKLEKAVSWWTGLDTREAASREALTDIGPKITRAEARVETAAAALKQAEADLRKRQTALSDLETERGKLLGGEATETHRTRHNTLRLNAFKAQEEAGEVHASWQSAFDKAEQSLKGIRDGIAPVIEKAGVARTALDEALNAAGMSRGEATVLLVKGPAEVSRIEVLLKKLDDDVVSTTSTTTARQEDLALLLALGLPEQSEAELSEAFDIQGAALDAKRARQGAAAGELESDRRLMDSLAGLDRQITEATGKRDIWLAINKAIGSREGGKFAEIAQGITLGMLVERANIHLEEIAPRYRLASGATDLALHIIDQDMGDEVRSTRSISGGERFLVSLSLALALSGMGTQGAVAGTLFIDEGFGSLDAESLDIAMCALETLQSQGRTIGVISHVEAMKDRIRVQVRVTRRGGGASSLELAA